MKQIVMLLPVLALFALLNPAAFAQTGSSGYHLVDSIKLGGEGGWDYCVVDTATGRLFTSRGTHTQVVDLVKKTVIGDISPTNGVHGIALVHSTGKGYISNGRDSSVTVFDLATLKTDMVVKLDARNPDAIMFDPASNRVFTFNGGSASATAIDVQTNKVVGTVPLSGKPEFAVSDGKGKVYVNIEDKSELTAFDSKTLKVLSTWPLAPGEEPSGLAFDRENGILFSVCSNRLMVILSADSGKIITTLPIGQGVDAAAFDPFSHLAFSSNGEGTMTVVREESPVKFSVVDNVPTRRGARTMALDMKAHTIYMVTAKFGPPPAPTPDRPHPRPSIEPGSVTLYVVSR